MTVQLRVPALPESVADATVVTWHKKVGDTIQRDENLVDLETDKVVLEVPFTQEGILKEILKPVGSVVKADEVLAIIEPQAAGTVAAAPKSEAKTSASAPVAPAKPASSSAPVSTTNVSAGPAARRVAAENEIDLTKVAGSGKGGRVTSDDVKQGGKGVVAERVEERVPMSRLRARVAERLLSAQHNAAILTTFNEVNLKNVMELRARYKDVFEKKYGIRLGFMSFFTRAVVEALKRFPAVNAYIDGSDVVYHSYCDIGIAVSTERGLVVPIIRNAERLSFAEIEQQVAEYGKKARDSALTIEEMTGGTFTITNGGVFGSLLATPIINPPQSAILGMHKIEERPIAENGQIVIRPMMYIALSYDHRIIDGKESVGFLVAVKEFLEQPGSSLLGV